MERPLASPRRLASTSKLTVLIKGRYYVVNLRKMTIYYPNVDLVNDNVYTKGCVH